MNLKYKFMKILISNIKEIVKDIINYGWNFKSLNNSHYKQGMME